jgi:triosephosphate isomerase
MKKKYLFVANWKMQLPVNHAVQLCADNSASLKGMADMSTIVVCPSFEALYPVSKVLEDTGAALGAQNCSMYRPGAYTGEVSARSLAELGCTYCIVGHSERRLLSHETNQDTANKIARLIENNITPLICIGETKQEYEDKKTKLVLATQLQLLTTIQLPHHCIFAYEPVWAIGTGQIPTQVYLTEVFAWIRQHCATQLPGVARTLLYGGSVTDQNIKNLTQIKDIDGFLIGGASLDFQKFQNIVSLAHEPVS